MMNANESGQFAADRESLERDLLALVGEQVVEHALLLLDAEGRVVSWYCGAEEILGYTAEEMYGQRLDRIFTPEDRERGLPQHELDVAANNGRAEDDRWTLRKDGTRIWATGAVCPLRGPERELIGFAKIMRDRTDLKAHFDVLENQIESLSRAAEERRVFFGALAHELRNPLSALVSATQLITLATKDASDLQAPLQMMGRQVASLRRLVDDLSDMTRIDAGKVRLELSDVDVGEAIRDAADNCRPIVEEHRHTIQIIVPEAPICIEADAGRVHQVLVNLISNAAKYTNDGGRIWVKATVEGHEAVIRVEDSGVGISPEMLPHIFELFTQVESSVPRSAGGLGIGLALVKDLVALHHGTVQVRSDGLDKGSEFTVRLPLVQAKAASEATPPRR